MSCDKIGGEGLTVEIDKSKFGKTKYHKGRYIQEQWIFGSICHETKQFFVTPVEKRDSATLIPIIVEKEGNKNYGRCLDLLLEAGAEINNKHFNDVALMGTLNSFIK